MKKTLMIVGLLALTAVAAQAYVQPGQLSPGVNSATPSPKGYHGLDTQDDALMPGDRDVRPQGEEQPSPAVPEPGTMALASMGLMAAGAALRRRRSSS
jgi:hypothetical protein